MHIIPQGDYYVWDCDWCDSRNRTLWTRIDDGKVLCGACQATFPIACLPHAPEKGRLFGS